MSKRLRLIELIVQPIVVEDDGEHLAPVGIQQVTIPASRLATLPEDLLSALADEQERRNQEVSGDQDGGS